MTTIIPEPTYDKYVQSYTATVCGRPVYGPTRAECNDRIYEVLGNRRRFLRHDPTAADLLRDPAAPLAAASPTPGAGGATGGDAPAPDRWDTEGWGFTGALSGFPDSPFADEGGAADAGAAPPAIHEGAPDDRPFHELDADEIMVMTPAEFSRRFYADVAGFDCARGPCSICNLIGQCDEGGIQPT